MTDKKKKNELSDKDLKELKQKFEREVKEKHGINLGSTPTYWGDSTKIKFKAKGGRVGLAHGAKRHKGGWTA